MFLSKVKLVMTAATVMAGLAAGAVALAQSGIGKPKDGISKVAKDQEHQKIVLTSPKAMDVTITQRYVCQIRSKRHIIVRSLENGYLSEINVRDGQTVKQGDLMFKIVRTLDKAKPAAKSANVVAAFDGIVDRPHAQLGSLIDEGDILTTLSDNSVMWVYFGVPDKQYFEYMAARKQNKDEDSKVELVLTNGKKFPQSGKINAIEGQFNDEKTGTISFRADFPNPDRLLRHGQTGTILLHRKFHDATVIPMQAVFPFREKRYVYVVDKDDVAHGREIVPQLESDDICVIKKGIGAGDRIVLEGIRKVHNGEKLEYEFRSPEQVMRKLKNHAD